MNRPSQVIEESCSTPNTKASTHFIQVVVVNSFNCPVGTNGGMRDNFQFARSRHGPTYGNTVIIQHTQHFSDAGLAEFLDCWMFQTVQNFQTVISINTPTFLIHFYLDVTQRYNQFPSTTGWEAWELGPCWGHGAPECGNHSSEGNGVWELW